VATKEVAHRQPWVVEVVRWVVRQTQPLHHTRGPHVGRNRERDDLFQVNAIETISNCCARSLASEPAAPIIAREPPTDFYCRREVRFEVLQREADIADAFGFSR